MCHLKFTFILDVKSKERLSGMSRVLSESGIPASVSSRPLSTRELRALCCHRSEQTILIELTETGTLPATAACARLAPHAPASHLTLEYSEADPHSWRVRTVRPAGPGEELRLWPGERELAVAGVPFLTPVNIRGKRNYVCHECGEQFEEPNPLKMHLYLSCKPHTDERFWDEFLLRHQENSHPLNNIYNWNNDWIRSAFTPARGLTQLEPAHAEVLATAWARAAGATLGSRGHRCVWCGKIYSRAYGLKIHVRTHTGYKPLRCPHCARAFGDPSNLNKHVRLHNRRRDSSPETADIRPYASKMQLL